MSIGVVMGSFSLRPPNVFETSAKMLKAVGKIWDELHRVHVVRKLLLNF